MKRIKIPEVKTLPRIKEENIKKRVGIMGGTFNPPHLGHMIIAQQVLSQLNLDEILFIPDNVPPHVSQKKTIDAQTRLEMTKLSTQSNPKFHVDNIELLRGGKSYTYDTIKELKEKNPENEYYFIIGGDMVDYLHTWYQIDKLIKLVHFVGVERLGYRKESIYPILWVDIPVIDISSTKIRRKVKNGESIKYLVDEKVEKFIEKEGLYRD